eukprot:1953499-Karenia_brevis.AAC.1
MAQICQLEAKMAPKTCQLGAKMTLKTTNLEPKCFQSLSPSAYSQEKSMHRPADDDDDDGDDDDGDAQ